MSEQLIDIDLGMEKILSDSCKMAETRLEHNPPNLSEVINPGSSMHPSPSCPPLALDSTSGCSQFCGHAEGSRNCPLPRTILDSAPLPLLPLSVVPEPESSH